MTLLGAVTQANQPAAGVTQVIAGLLQGLRRDLGKTWVRGRLERLVHLQLPRVEQKLTDHRAPEVAVRLLHEAHVAILVRPAQEGEIVLAAALALDLSGIVIEQPGLADEVQRDVGETEVFLQRRRVTDPLGDPLSEDQIAVCKSKQVIGRRPGRHQMFFTSSGMS